MAYRGEKKEQQELALERMERLMKLAFEESRSGEEELSRRHVKLAKAVGMRYNVRMPLEFRGKYCKSCSVYFTPENVKARVNSKEKKLEVKCLSCGGVMRRNYK